MIATAKKRRKKKHVTFSLFCGIGGEHLAKRLAFRELGIPDECCQHWALNHCEVAISALNRNFPDTHTYCEKIEQFEGRCIGLKSADFLWASPDCTHFSRAGAGRPKDSGRRALINEVI